MNDDYDELIINKYIKTIQVTYVHVSFQQFVMVGKINEKELCCVIFGDKQIYLSID